jgi:hypothetical protein
MKSVRVRPTAAQIAASGAPDYYQLNLRPHIVGLMHNPTVANSCAGANPLLTTPLPAGTTILCGVPLSGSAQQFNVCKPEGVVPETEALSWQWYVSAGDFPEAGGVGNARGNDLKFERPPGAFTLWAILRDSRGGDDWVTVVVSAL